MPRKARVQTSLTTPPPVKGKGKSFMPLPTADELTDMFKDFKNIDVLSRRFHSPNLPGSLPILLKDESPASCTNSEHMNRLKPGAATCQCGLPARRWYVRWFNLGKENRNAEMRALAYEPVQIVELMDANDISDLYRSSADVYVRRGDHGKEVLAKLPLTAYNVIKAKQRQQWNETSIKPKKVRESLAEAAGAALGDEAGQSIHDGAIQVESMTRSRTTLGEESGLEAE